MTAVFVVLCPMRTGSNLLISMLQSHPAAAVGGELFNLRHTDTIQWPDAAVRDDADLVELRRTDPVKFLEHLHEGAVRAGRSAFGFKLIYSHGVHRPEVAEHLAAVPELKVVHLRRHNLLRRLVSERRAQALDAWQALASDRAATPPARVEIDFEDCVADFLQVLKHERGYRELFAGHATLDLEYEELAADPQATGAKTLAFLGLEPHELAVRHRKTGTDALRDGLANYDDLRGRFAAWLDYFE